MSTRIEAAKGATVWLIGTVLFAAALIAVVAGLSWLAHTLTADQYFAIVLGGVAAIGWICVYQSERRKS